MKKILITLGSLLLALAGSHLSAVPLGTAFTYQGRLTDGANPASGSIPMVFGLWDDQGTSGNNVGSPSSISANVTVVNGLFAIDLDFGPAAFNGDARWLEIRINGILQTPRQRVAPTPNAIYALTAGTVKNGAIQASQLGTADAPINGQILSYNDGSLLWQTPGGANLWSVNNGSAYYNGGNVGIGTISPSTYGHGGTARILEVNNSGTTVHSQAHLMLSSGVDSILDSSIGTVTWAQPGGMAAFIGAHTRSTTPNAPAARLVLGTRNIGDGSALERMVIHEDGNVSLNKSLNFGGRLDQLINLYSDGVNFYGLGMQGGTLYSRCGTQSGDAFAWHKGGAHVNNSRDPGPGGKTLMTLDEERGLYINGKVGIGTFAPQSGLEVIVQDAVKGVGFQPFFTLADTANAGYAICRIQGVGGDVVLETAAYISSLNPAAGSMVIKSGSGNVGIGTGNPQAKLDVAGNASVCTLTIRGGCDVAEPFQMSAKEIPAGAVVVIDEENPGKLTLSTRAYDNRVAGIVSGANGVSPGISLHQEGLIEGGQNVALSGRVYVQADASSSPIKPGDLLTTSNVPGHAMKVTDLVKAQGAVLGKAMSALKEGKGIVLVLVSLQ